MNILCSGLNELNSGKTTLTVALIRYFKELNKNVCGFKPRSGNNVWRHWPLVSQILEKGKLYGKDGKILFEESQQDLDIYALNPVHRLWGPRSSEISWGALPNFLLDRISTGENNYIAINKKIDFPVHVSYFEKLLDNSEIIPITTTKDLNELNELYMKADHWGYAKIREKCDTIIYESYSDIGLPSAGINELDYAFVIEPFTILIYQGDRYLKALEYASTISYEIKTIRIIELLKPIKKLSIPPFAKHIEENLKEYLKSELDLLFGI
jgi:predicted P-loop ATPase/GTPase